MTLANVFFEEVPMKSGDSAYVKWGGPGRVKFCTSLSARAYESAESLWFSDLTTIPLFSRSPWVLERELCTASFCWVDRGQAMSIHLGTDPDALRLGLQDQGLAERLTREGASFWGDVPRSLRQWRQEVGAGKDFRLLLSA